MCTSETRSTREIGSEGPAQSQKGFSFTFFIPFFSSELHPRAASAAAGGAPALAPFACAARWRRDGGEGARSARGARGQAKRGGEAHLGRDASARRGRRAPSLRGGGCQPELATLLLSHRTGFLRERFVDRSFDERSRF